MESNAQTKERVIYSGNSNRWKNYKTKKHRRTEKLIDCPIRYHCMTKTSIILGEEEFRTFKDKELDKKIIELRKYLDEQNYGMLRYIVLEAEQRRASYGFEKVS